MFNRTINEDIDLVLYIVVQTLCHQYCP